MGFFEIFMVLIVAIIFLGPDKLPQALIDLAKFFKAVKKTLDDAKTSIDKELNLEELKKEALEYKHSFTQSLETLNEGIKINDEIHALDHFENSPEENKDQAISKELAQNNPIEKNQILSSAEPITTKNVHLKPNKTHFEETFYKDS